MFYLVLDTETITNARIPYNVGWVLCDEDGNIFAFNDYLVSEIVYNKSFIYAIKKDSFAKKTYDHFFNPDNEVRAEYIDKVLNFKKIQEYLNSIIDAYDAIVVAYNALFDVSVLDNYSNMLLGKDFFNDEVKVWDLWSMTLDTICNDNNYCEWCGKNDKFTEKGNIQCGAETVYGYLIDNPNYQEKHTALADCNIEMLIMLVVFDSGKSFTTDYVSPIFSNRVWNKRLKKN